MRLPDQPKKTLVAQLLRRLIFGGRVASTSNYAEKNILSMILLI